MRTSASPLSLRKRLSLLTPLSVQIYVTSLALLIMLMVTVALGLHYSSNAENQVAALTQRLLSVSQSLRWQYDARLELFNFIKLTDNYRLHFLVMSLFMLCCAVVMPWALLRRRYVERFQQLSSQIDQLLLTWKDTLPVKSTFTTDQVAAVDDAFEGDDIHLMSTQLQQLRDTLEQQLRMTQLTEQARARAEQDLVRKGDLLASVSHDIRTPLSAVIGYLDLTAKQLPAEQREMLLKAKQSALGLLGLLNDLLDAAKIEAGKVELCESDLDFSALLNELGNICGIMAEKKNISLVLDVPADLPDLLWGDVGRVRQILMNVVSNAIKFTEKGHVLLKLRAQTREDGVDVTMTISDTGIGMSPEQQRTLFRSFVQAEQQISQRYGGTGLGLSITKQLTELMGGHITVQSQLGQGSVFTVALPFKRLRHQARPSLPRFDGQRVMIIDTVEVQSYVIQAMLEKAGAECFAYYSLPACLHAIHAGVLGMNLPAYWIINADLLLLEPELCERLLQALRHASSTQIVVGVIGHLHQSEMMSRLKKLNITRYVHRPFSPEQLLQSMDQYRGVSSVADAMAVMPDGEVGQDDPRPLQGTRILVAEDALPLLEIASESLLALGAEVECVANGREAVAAIQTATDPYDVVLMDIQMPVLDGIDATKEIRHFFSKDDLPIAALTAHVMENERQRCLEAGMNAHLCKPIDVKQITDWILSSVKHKLHLRSHLIQSTIRLSDALHRLGGNRILLERILQRFREQFRDYEKRFDVLQSSTVQLARHAHELKGLATTLSAQRVGSLAANLEQACREQQAFSSLDAICVELRAALTDLFWVVDHVSLDGLLHGRGVLQEHTDLVVQGVDHPPA